MIPNDPQKDYIEYVFNDAFKYESFREKMIPLLTDSIDWPDCEEVLPNTDTLVEDTADYSFELGEMLDRMNLSELDGLRGFDTTVSCTYIECVTSQCDGWLTKYSRFPVNVCADIRIVSKNRVALLNRNE